MRRVLRSFVHAWEGLRYVWSTQPNFRVECAVAALALALSLWLGVGTATVLLLILMVLALELVNSAIEALVDLVTGELHPLAKTAKDAAAAAVLLASLIALIIGLWLFAPPLIAKISAYGKIS